MLLSNRSKSFYPLSAYIGALWRKELLSELKKMSIFVLPQNSQFTCNLSGFLFSQLQIPTATYCKLAQLQRSIFTLMMMAVIIVVVMLMMFMMMKMMRMTDNASSTRGTFKFQHFTSLKTIPFSL